ncbi:MAG: TerB family tellurite resistance protein [Thermodesulfobacteriota bacterium]
MLRNIKGFFDKKIRPAGGVTSSRATARSLQMATAALLIEAAGADAHVSEVELEAVKEGLGSKFGIKEAEIGELMALARQEADGAVSLYEFTSLIDKGFKYVDKRHIIELLWEVVYADSLLEKHEEHLVRRIADLLQVRHRDFIETKLSVKKRRLNDMGEDK